MQRGNAMGSSVDEARDRFKDAGVQQQASISVQNLKALRSGARSPASVNIEHICLMHIPVFLAIDDGMGVKRIASLRRPPSRTRHLTPDSDEGAARAARAPKYLPADGKRTPWGDAEVEAVRELAEAETITVRSQAQSSLLCLSKSARFPGRFPGDHVWSSIADEQMAPGKALAGRAGHVNTAIKDLVKRLVQHIDGVMR